MTQTKLTQHLPSIFGIVGVVAFIAVLVSAQTGRDTLGWIYLQSSQAIDRSIHVSLFQPDRLDPTCPQCM